MGSVQDDTAGWYAIRVPYGREMKLRVVLDSLGVRSFIPMQYRKKLLRGKEVNEQVPAISNLIFIHAARAFLDDLKARMEATTPFRYIMDKGSKKPITVSEADMENFIAVAGTMDEQLLFLTQIDHTLENGSRVRVTDGIFRGIEGRVVRIKKDRRVMVSINNVIAVVTAYINPVLLEKLED